MVLLILIFVKGRLSCRTFCPAGRFVLPDVLSRRTFGRRTYCLSERFVSPDVLSDGRFVRRTFGRRTFFRPDVLSLQTFCRRTFCLGTFKNSRARGAFIENYPPPPTKPPSQHWCRSPFSPSHNSRKIVKHTISIAISCLLGPPPTSCKWLLQ